METLPVVVEVHALEAEEAREAELERRAGPPLSVRQAAAMVAGGFVAGAASVSLARLAAGIPARRERRRGELRRPEIVASRSILVDVYLIDRR